MSAKQIDDYFAGVAAKYLSAVDADPVKSNQHEIGGLPSVGFKQYLGQPGKEEKLYFNARMAYIPDDTESPEIFSDAVTWYDCRDKQPQRSPEYRLYYKSNPVTELINEGDFFLIAMQTDGSLLLIFTPPESAVENQLRVLFGLDTVDKRFKKGEIEKSTLLLPLQILLEELGIEILHQETDDDEWLSRILAAFGDQGFPTTAKFSAFARRSLQGSVNPLEEADLTLLTWMDREEKLFRIFERYFVQQRLQQGFGEHGDDVDAFISFSLSVQNRRKSRVGHAFEGHLDTLFKLHQLKFEQGRGKGKTTENNARPDFLFPDFSSYRNAAYPQQNLRILGAKTTCKDRWRQVLSEADKIKRKHLVTLEPAISETQTNEMQSHGLQLIVPQGIHSTYKPAQQSWLMTVADFINEIKQIQPQ